MIVHSGNVNLDWIVNKRPRVKEDPKADLFVKIYPIKSANPIFFNIFSNLSKHDLAIINRVSTVFYAKNSLFEFVKYPFEKELDIFDQVRTSTKRKENPVVKTPSERAVTQIIPSSSSKKDVNIEGSRPAKNSKRTKLDLSSIAEWHHLINHPRVRPLIEYPPDGEMNIDEIDEKKIKDIEAARISEEDYLEIGPQAYLKKVINDCQPLLEIAKSCMDYHRNFVKADRILTAIFIRYSKEDFFYESLLRMSPHTTARIALLKLKDGQTPASGAFYEYALEGFAFSQISTPYQVFFGAAFAKYSCSLYDQAEEFFDRGIRALTPHASANILEIAERYKKLSREQQERLLKDVKACRIYYRRLT